MTMTLISTVTIPTSGTASIQFTGIPQTGTDLLILCSMRTQGSTLEQIQMSITGAGTTPSVKIWGTGTSPNTNSFTNTAFIGYMNQINDTANSFGNTSIYISNYSGAQIKTIMSDSVAATGSTASLESMNVLSSGSTSAITEFTLNASTYGTLTAGSTASLYMITKGSGGATVA